MRFAQPLFSNISINDQDVVGFVVLIADQSPSGHDIQHASVLGSLTKLCVPNIVGVDRSLRLLQRFLVREDNLRQRASDGLGFRNAVDLFRAKVPVRDLMIKVTYQDRVLCLVKKGSLLPNAFLGEFSLCYLITNGNVLEGFPGYVQKRNNGRVDPVDGTVFRAVTELAVPYVSVCDRRPDISNEFLRVISGIDYTMILSDQFFP